MTHRCVWARTAACIWLFFPLFSSLLWRHTEPLSNTVSVLTPHYTQKGALPICCIATKSWSEIGRMRRENVERRKWSWVASLHVWLELIQNQIYERQLLRAWQTDECRDSCVAAAAAQRTDRLCVSEQHSSKGKQRFQFYPVLSFIVAIKSCYSILSGMTYATMLCWKSYLSWISSLSTSGNACV